MKHKSFFVTLVVLAGTVVLTSAAAKAQNGPPRAPRGGFDRPLAETPRMGNPGQSPSLTVVEFKALLARWSDYDVNKNQRFDKAETPELFGRLFDQADTNRDGALDEKERAAVKEQAAAPPQPSAPKRAQTSGPVIDPLSRLLFGDPVFGGPPIPSAAK